MFAFTVQRFFQAILVILVISFIGFAIKSHVGDPVWDLLGMSASEAHREELRAQLGLNDPFYIQYMRFLRNAVTGDLGHSFFYKKPNLQVIISKAPATLELVLVTMLLTTVLSIPGGVYIAIKPKSFVSKLIMGTSILGISIPVFLVAILFIYIFSVELRVLPSFGRGITVNILGWNSGLLTLDGLKHLILPSLTLTGSVLPMFIRLICSEMMEILESEYIKFAWAKGLHPKRIWYVHAFKNTLLPVITFGGVQIGALVAYTIITETVFQWGGTGYMFLEAVQRADTSLLIAYMIVVGTVFVVINTVVDLLYGLINPRVRITH